MRRRVLMLLSAIVLISAMSAQALAAREITVRGRLGRTVEGGGWIIQTDSEKYLVLNFQRFQNESWFHVGQMVEASGEARPDVITTQMEGTPFEVRVMRPFDEGASGAQITGGTSRRPTRVLVTGDAITQAQPDTAIITVAVITQAKRALDAQQQNATQADAVVRALKAVVGTSGEIKTSGYNLQPITVYNQNQPPTITGYQASNSVIVTLSDLTKVGAVIDAAAQAGANNVQGVVFTLRNDRQAKQQALAEATREAVSKAQAIAQALGGRVVRIVEVQEGGAFVRPIEQNESLMMRGRATAEAQTPIQVGSLDINSQVQLVAEIEMPQ
ncbi:MAG TPA: SIMPL domain-containing protein [Pyrinomonadaceae bacterium]|nr:SIMPL domain-containing protein [Pyrinomonadaceae bacterium]